MGRRARKRPPRAAPTPVAAGRRPRLDERPKAPWDPFPLVELTAFAAIGLFVAGLVVGLDSPSGGVLLVAALAFGSIAGLDTAVREHFAGFRSHSLLLAGVPAVLGAGILFFARAPWPAVSAVALIVFAGGFTLFRRAFRRASGGLAWR